MILKTEINIYLLNALCRTIRQSLLPKVRGLKNECHLLLLKNYVSFSSRGL
jgi:hypothetical protein